MLQVSLPDQYRLQATMDRDLARRLGPRIRLLRESAAVPGIEAATLMAAHVRLLAQCAAFLDQLAEATDVIRALTGDET